MQNATIASPVFQVLASDPDNPSTPSGTLTFSIQDDNEDAKTFRIGERPTTSRVFRDIKFTNYNSFSDSETGLITTRLPLDRETKSSYKIIIEVSDDGQPPQSVTRVLHINVLDIDDHKPRFNREIVSDL